MLSTLTKNKKSPDFSELFAVWTGLEPATPCVTGMYSNQLNYQTNSFNLSINLAVWTGLEPATPCVTGMYSNQLNYQTKLLSPVVPGYCGAKLVFLFFIAIPYTNKILFNL